jgi:hypothetical protein
MNEKTGTEQPSAPVAGVASEAWREFQIDLAELRAFNAELAALSEQRRTELDSARRQVEALRKALAALRDLAQHTSDPEILRMSIEELADSALGE